MTFDYVVVGAGSAGCVIAARLSENIDTQVLLLEAGPGEGPASMSVPSAWLGLLGSEVDWGYSTVPQKGTNNRVHFYPRGKVLGGSSSINGMGFIRGHRHDFDSWVLQGAEGWGYGDVLPYFRRMEHVEDREPGYRGLGGPMRPAPVTKPTPLFTAFLEAAEERHYPITADFNGSVQEGAGRHDLSIADGRRQSVADAYLRPVMERPNLTVCTEVQAQRLLFDGRSCTGVEYRSRSGLQQVRTEGEVILSAGAIDSPRLLLLSGIGPADHLREVGIETRHHLPGVGANLHDHPFLGFVVEARQDIPPSTAQHGEVSVVWRSDPGLPGPDMQFMFLDVPQVAPAFHAPQNSYTTGIATVPRSRGRLWLASADPEEPALIDPNFLGHEDDMRRMVLGIRQARELNAAAALVPWRRDEVLPGPGLESDTELRGFVARSVSTYFHPVGTCRMGTDEQAVVDPQLRVHGVEGLRVADASVMPSIVSVNTNPAVIMIGEKAAAMIRGE